MENQNNTHDLNTGLNSDAENKTLTNDVSPDDHTESQDTDNSSYEQDLSDIDEANDSEDTYPYGEFSEDDEEIYTYEAQNSEKVIKERMLSVLEFFEVFVFSIFIVLFVFSFAFRVCVVDGDSMKNTLHNGEKLVTRDLFYSPECGDIIVFYENEPLNKPLVKRVIATEGQTIEINYVSGTVTVDGELLDEEYVYLSGDHYILFPNYVYDKNTKIFTATVPDGMLFVMGDNRNDSWDSRSYDISFISEEQIMGKVICRISPFSTFN